MKVIGIDLAGLEKNPSGFCILTGKGSEAKILYYDSDIIKEIEREDPDVIAIDAPFSFPDEGYFRDGDFLLKKEGHSPLSPKFPGMQPLVKRAIKLVRILREKRHVVIEVFPRATENILSLSRERGVNKDQYDALLCALTGKHYLEGKFKVLGKEKIIIPEIE